MEVLSTACNEVTRSHCFASRLPYLICVTNGQGSSGGGDFAEGYVDYADQHKDFNGDGGCTHDKYAGPSGDGDTSK